MADLKTYSISSDITGGVVNTNLLADEIISAVAVTNFIGVRVDGDVLVVMGGSLPPPSEEGEEEGDLLDSVVLAHIAVPLSDYKKNRKDLIDDRTDELIALGFTHDGETFSMSQKAQGNWDSMLAGDIGGQSSLSYPFEVSTKDDLAYSITNNAAMKTFWDAYFNFLNHSTTGHLKTGRDLRVLIDAAVDEAAVDAIEDTR